MMQGPQPAATPLLVCTLICLAQRSTTSTCMKFAHRFQLFQRPTRRRYEIGLTYILGTCFQVRYQRIMWFCAVLCSFVTDLDTINRHYSSTSWSCPSLTSSPQLLLSMQMLHQKCYSSRCKISYSPLIYQTPPLEHMTRSIRNF